MVTLPWRLSVASNISAPSRSIPINGNTKPVLAKGLE